MEQSLPLQKNFMQLLGYISLGLLSDYLNVKNPLKFYNSTNRADTIFLVYDLVL